MTNHNATYYCGLAAYPIKAHSERHDLQAHLRDLEMSVIVRIKEEYASLVPEIPPQDYQSLKQNIKENGQHLPIILNQDGILLDGHHRYRVCKDCI